MFCLYLDNFAMTPCLRNLSIFLNLCYLLVPCRLKDHVKVQIETKGQHECTQREYQYTKTKKCKYICSEIIKVHQKKDKDQEFQCDECEYKCYKRDTQEP